jgi:hypothetical protein
MHVNKREGISETKGTETTSGCYQSVLPKTRRSTVTGDQPLNGTHPEDVISPTGEIEIETAFR